ncbi:MAG: acetoacetate--CoA ligase [Deltaproteobacteria bacterium]|nr:acetoacetate--CoA ligase [Deltaproteobacteria bacterium]
MTQPLWTPTAERVRGSNLARLMAEFRPDLPISAAAWDPLWQWSVDRPAEFWPAVWQFGDVIASRKWDSVLEDGERMPGARWFSGSRLNFAENLLRFTGDDAAIVFRSENGARRTVSWDELRNMVAALRGYLINCGVTVGDRVAAFLPNIPETIAAMLATTSIGAIWSSTSPDFGARGVIERFSQIEPKVLITSDGYFYGGKAIDSISRTEEILRALPTVRHVVLVRYHGPDGVPVSQHQAPSEWTTLESILAATPPPLAFEQLPFDHPVYILYSSGTTGVPKCIVHGAGGTLLQHIKELALHTDVKRGERIFYFTTCGWMMWNWLVSSLALGATVQLFDGSPLTPSAETLPIMLEEEGIQYFGTSARYLLSAEKLHVTAKRREFPKLRTILSTGSPLPPSSFEYVYREWKGDVALASISGGTDIVSCFALGNPLLPVYAGEIQSRGLGLAVDVFDESGRAIVGEKGELVCTKPFPAMPVKFWNDPGDERYLASYFAMYPNIWRHGDWVELTPRGGLVIFGRSDAVLNPGGVRIGTAEIYREVEQMKEILESVVTAQQWENDERIVLFVKLRPGVVLDDELRERIRKLIRAELTPRHVPAKIIAVPDIPKTVSGKTVELAVKNVIHGRPVKNADALANPEALAHFENLSELRD